MVYCWSNIIWINTKNIQRIESNNIDYWKLNIYVDDSTEYKERSYYYWRNSNFVEHSNELTSLPNTSSIQKLVFLIEKRLLQNHQFLYGTCVEEWSQKHLEAKTVGSSSSHCWMKPYASLHSAASLFTGMSLKMGFALMMSGECMNVVSFRFLQSKWWKFIKHNFSKIKFLLCYQNQTILSDMHMEFEDCDNLPVQ